MLHDVVDGAADAVGERDLGVEAGNQGFKFRVVEDDAVNGNYECSDFGNLKCSVFSNKSTSFSVTMMQQFR